MWSHGPSVLSAGMQVVVIETGRRPAVVGGDVAVWFGELDEPHTEGQLRLRALARPRRGSRRRWLGFLTGRSLFSWLMRIAGGWIHCAEPTNPSRSAATRSGRSQLAEWPVSGYTVNCAPGIAAARRCCPSTPANGASCSPHRINVGAVIRSSSPASSNASRPSNALCQTRAGAFRLSLTIPAKNSRGRGCGARLPGTRARTPAAAGPPAAACPPGPPASRH